MADAMLGDIGAVLTRWTMGGGAARHAPPAWRDMLGSDPDEAELRLLALSGQVLGALTVAEPVGAWRPRGDIPALAHPPLPERYRPWVRRLLQAMREPMLRRDLLDFVETRGWTLHPGDWMPRPDEDVPDCYAPWQDWAAGAGASAMPGASGAEALTADSWDDFGPAARLVAFAALRQQDPAAAAMLLAGKIAGEPPDHRVRLLQTLAPRLSTADRALLEQLGGDRAPRVRALAAGFLGDLDGTTSDEEGAATLAGFFAVQTRGLLRRTRVIAALPPKNAIDRNRRTEWFGKISFDGFARALGLPPPEMVALWPWGDDALADRCFAQMAARSAPAPVVAAMADALSTARGIDGAALALLVSRLSLRQRHEIAGRLIAATGVSFGMIRSIAGGSGAIDDAIRTPAGKALLDAVKAGDAAPGDRGGELLALGLVASHAAAGDALDRLAAAGLIAADPRLDMLRLNAALDHRRPTQ